MYTAGLAPELDDELDSGRDERASSALVGASGLGRRTGLLSIEQLYGFREDDSPRILAIGGIQTSLWATNGRVTSLTYEITSEEPSLLEVTRRQAARASTVIESIREEHGDRYAALARDTWARGARTSGYRHDDRADQVQLATIPSDVADRWIVEIRRESAGAVSDEAPAIVSDAWAKAWHDAAVHRRAIVDRYCGASVVETQHVLRDTSGSIVDARTTCERWRCRTSRCRHCAAVHHRPKWEQRIASALAELDARGERIVFCTFTIDRRTYMRERNYAAPAHAAIACQREIGAMAADLLALLRREHGAIEWIRVIETHAEDAWPHVHVIAYGAIVDAMLDEGRARVAARADRGAGRDTWDGLVRYAAAQRAAKASGAIRVARCPTPSVRARLAELAREAGFGGVCGLWPIGRDDHDRVARYLAKGPHDERDRPWFGPLAGELAKDRQRAGRLIAPTIRVWQATRGWPRVAVVLDDVDEREGWETWSRRILPVDLSEYVMRGPDVMDAVRTRADCRAPVPERGSTRDRDVEWVDYGRQSPYEMMLDAAPPAARIMTDADIIRELTRRYAPSVGPSPDDVSSADGDPNAS